MLAAKEEEEIVVPSVLKVKRRTTDVKTIRQPQKLGGFTIEKTAEGERKFRDDDLEMRILNLPRNIKQTHFDLKEGYIPIHLGGKVFGVGTENGLVELLQWLLLNRDRFRLKSNPDPSQPETPFNTDFICYRGELTKIMQMPYENQDDILIGCTLFKGTIYMNGFKTDYKRESEQDVNDDQNIFSYGGLRFEEYVSVPAFPEKAQNAAHGAHHEYCCVVRSKLDQITMAYGAEIDCIKPGADPSNAQLGDFVELKTTKTITNDRMKQSFYRFKAGKWWSQSYLVGTPTILCGHRDQDLVIRKLEFFEVNDLPQKSFDYWNYKACLNFLNDFLTHVKSIVTEDDHRCVYKFYWQPPANHNFDRGHMTCTKTYSEKFRILPDWFAQKVNDMKL